jgi:hypothetical protein
VSVLPNVTDVRRFLNEIIQLSSRTIFASWISPESQLIAFELNPELPSEVKDRINNLVKEKTHIPPLLFSMTNTAEEYIGELQYMIIVRKGFQGILIPHHKSKMVLSVGVSTEEDSKNIAMKVIGMLNDDDRIQ